MNEEKEQMQYISMDLTDPDPDQPRTGFDEESLQGLAESLSEVGQLVPIRVRLVDGRFLIIDGGRRYLAAKRAGFETLAAIVESKDLCRGEITQRQLIANCQREDLTPLEKSIALHGLMEATGWNASTIARKLGVSNATISRLLALRQLPEAIREGVDRGEIPLSSAIELAKEEDKEVQAANAIQVASGALSRDALAGARKAKRNAKDSSQSSVRRVSCKLTSGSSVTVAADSLDMENLILALEEVLSEARKARTKGYEVSTLSKMFRDQARA